MNYKIILTICLLLCSGVLLLCYTLLPMRVIRPETNIQADLKRLDAFQLACIKKFVAIDQVLFVKPQADQQVINVGYKTSEGINATVLNFHTNNLCTVKWQDKITGLADVWENIYDPVFEEIKVVELTGDTVPEIYVWLDLYGNISKRKPGYDGVSQRNARHVIYAKQPNGRYEKVSEDILCINWSTVSFIPIDKAGQPRILIDEDRYCNMRRSYIRVYIEFILTNEGIQRIRRETKGSLIN